jgi:hypothetical protein
MVKCMVAADMVVAGGDMASLAVEIIADMAANTAMLPRNRAAVVATNTERD